MRLKILLFWYDKLEQVLPVKEPAMVAKTVI